MATHLDNCIVSGSDSELLGLIRESPTLEQHGGIALLSNRYLAKYYYLASVEDAIKAVDVTRKLGIRAPRFVRSVLCENMVIAIMERIEGRTLEVTWSSLGWWKSLRLAFQLRRFVLKMRSITSTTAGSLVTGKCRSFWVEDIFGLPARSEPEDISAFLSFWVAFRSIRQEFKKSNHHLTPRGPPCLQPGKLVFTHHDLAPRNLMVDTSGDLWLIDWDYAEFYPPYFEYASMHNFIMPRHWSTLARVRWHIFTWIAGGRFEQERRLPDRVRSRFHLFSAGRRCNIKARATKSSKRRRFSDSSELSDFITGD